MADDISLTDLVWSIPLVYDVANDYALKLRYGATVGVSEPRAIWHIPDDAPPEFIDIVDQTTVATFGILVDKTSDIDDPLNAVTVLRQGLNQAYRAGKNKRERPVYLKVQRNGATNATLRRVYYGYVDDSKQYDSVSVLNNIIYDAVLYLFMSPYGQAESSQELKNLVKNGAFLDISGGTATQWSGVATPTLAADTTNYLIGGQSQKITAVASGRGIQSHTFVLNNTSAVIYFWIYAASGTWTLSLFDDTAGSNEASASFSASTPANYDKTKKDAAGATWYRVPISSDSVTAGNDFRMKIITSSSSGVCSIDACYAYDGSTTAPDAWADYYLSYTRGDWTATNNTYRNRMMIWGIPGDAPALFAYQFASSSAQRIFLSHQVENRFGQLDTIFWQETLSGSGARWSTGTTGTYTGSGYETYDDNDTESSAIIGATFSNDGTAFQSWDAYGIIWVQNAAITCNATALVGAVTISLVQNIAITAGAWYIVRLGTITLQDLLQEWSQFDESISVGSFTVRMTFDVSGGTYGADAVKVDAVFLLPTEGKTVAEFNSSQSTFFIDYDREKVLVGATGGHNQNTIMAPYGLEAGVLNIMYYMLMTGTANSYSPSQSSAITTYILPRTRSLLGTI